MSDDRFAISLQQDLISLLTHSDDYGRSVAKLVDSSLFEGDYRVIAERALEFWRKFNRAPKQHIADLLSDILEDKHDRRGSTYRHILVQMFELKDHIDPEFVLRSTSQFIRVQTAKSVILEAAEKLDAQGVNGIQDVESLFHRFLTNREATLDRGLRLNELDKILEYFNNIHKEFRTGIRELDQANIVPVRSKLWLFVAPAKRGKTWALIQLGKMAFMDRKKVCHISLEIESEEVAQRYYQAMFGVSKRDEINKVSTLKFDKNGGLDQVVSQNVEVPFIFESPVIREELNTRINHFGTRVGNVLIKRFPMRSLTVEQLEAYLESLEALEGFIPDLVIVDYPGIMKTDAKNHRITLGRLVEELRGLAQRRNFALAAVHQTNRTGAGTELVTSTHAGEDWSVICTADFVVTYSQTKAEKRLGLARLFVDAARSELDNFGVLITQSYKTGQFVLESTKLHDDYAKILEGMKAEYEDDDTEDD